MKRLTLVLAALLAATSLSPAFAQRAAGFDDSVKAFVTTDAPLIAIRNVRVVPGDGRPALEGQTIVVRDGKIESIGVEPRIPRDAKVIDGTGLTDEARADYLQRRLRVVTGKLTGKTSRFGKPMDEAVKMEMAFERAFVAAGGLLVSGTDRLAGFSSIRQVELLVEAGFTPLEALKISSYNGAKYLERLDTIGTLEPGKQADLVLVRGKPDIDIKDLRKIETVFRDGIGYDSAKLIESARGKVGG